MKHLMTLAVLALLAASRAAALELSLEENKGESGTIGYVDIDRVFKDFSGTSNAREEFLAEIKAKEDSLNIKKQAIFALKADIAKLKQEREFALTLPGLMRQAQEISDAVAKAAEAPAPQASTDSAPGQPPSAPPLSTVPGFQAEPSSAAERTQLSTAAAQTADGAAALRQPGASFTPASVPVSTPSPVELPVGLPGMGAGIDMPGISRVPVNYFKFSVSTSVADIDSSLAFKEELLTKKQAELLQAQRQTERELLEYETRKSEMILGRIYMALKELAVKEGVSVVVDKRNILFGHSAVNLTEKLIEKLEENPL